MENNRKGIKNIFDKMTDEELRQFLEAAGFGVEDGDGKIIYTDTNEVIYSSQ